MAEQDAASGKHNRIPRIPKELLYLRYRKEMNLSWREFVETPLGVVMSDLEILNLQSDVLKSKQDAAVRKPK